MESKLTRKRLAFVDNIRWTVIAMVVLVHACVTYSGLGSWYYKEEGALGIVGTLLFTVYQTFSQAFFMGILFFLAAVLTPVSYDRKGFGPFLRDRLIRLGVPTLVYMLVLHPLTLIIREAGTGTAMSWAGVGGWYASYVASGDFLGSSGPLWFALALLVFTAVYAVVRRIADRLGSGKADRDRSTPLALTSRSLHGAAAVLIAVMALASFAVRLVQPMGTSVLNMQLCFFPQYVVLFVVGLWAGRRGLLDQLPRAAGLVWLRLSLVVGVPAWFLLVGLGGALSGSTDAYAGGWHWQAAGYAAWEAFFSVAFSLGLIVLYREKVAGRAAVTGLLADTSFGIYVFHAPVLVGVSMLARGLVLYAPLKALGVAAAAWLLSLAVAATVRRVPGVGRLFA